MDIKPFLDMIAVSEGTYGKGDDGYNVLVGGALWEHGYAEHPDVMVDLGHGLKSTAAGRYQILKRNYDAYKVMLDLPDFGHTSQDAIASQMIKECHALPDIGAGYFTLAITKCAHIWASLPGAGYGQHENTIDSLRAIYLEKGGIVS